MGIEIETVDVMECALLRVDNLFDASYIVIARRHAGTFSEHRRLKVDGGLLVLADHISSRPVDSPTVPVVSLSYKGMKTSEIVKSHSYPTYQWQLLRYVDREECFPAPRDGGLDPIRLGPTADVAVKSEPPEPEVAFLRRQVARLLHGCYALDCRKHGAYASVEHDRVAEIMNIMMLREQQGKK